MFTRLHLLYQGLSIVVPGLLLCACSPMHLKTKSYTWTPRLSRSDKAPQDWFALPSRKELRREQRKRLGYCAHSRMRPSLLNLKLLTRQCVHTAGFYRNLGQRNRAGYWTAISAGLVGGMMVLAAPVLTAATQNKASDASLVLTLSGASVTAASTLFIQVLALGQSSNQSFHRYSKLTRLIQNTEVHWDREVCQARTLSTGLRNATHLLDHLSQQCVTDRPDVAINPDIASVLKQKQGNVASLMEGSREVQEHTELAQEYQNSRSTMDELRQKISRTFEKVWNSQGKTRDRWQSRLRVLCLQADAEAQRYHTLRARYYRKEEAGVAIAPGSWKGLCQSQASQPTTTQIQPPTPSSPPKATTPAASSSPDPATASTGDDPSGS